MKFEINALFIPIIYTWKGIIMNIFDIIGPVMVGPSSSHTAGAVRLGLISRKLINEPIVNAKISLHGSFYHTGKGHGTDLAIVAGLLGLKEHDEKIPFSFLLAKEAGLEFQFSGIHLRNAHPNSALLKLIGKSGKQMELVGSSIGGGRIQINQIDGLEVEFSGDYPTLIVYNKDKPGLTAKVTSILGHYSINIAQMQIYRQSRGGFALMVVECDQQVPLDAIALLENTEGVVKISYLNPID